MEIETIRSLSREDLIELALQQKSKLAEKDEQIEALSTMTNVGLWVVDLGKMKLFWSKQVREIHDYDLEKAEPDLENGINFYHPDDREKISTAFSGATQGTSFDLQLRIISEKGIEKKVRSYGIPKFENGKVVKVYGGFQDITETEELYRTKERFFEVTLDMLCTANFEGYFEELSPTWKEVLGWSDDELRSKPYIEFVHPEDVGSTLNVANQLSEGNNIIQFENRYLTKYGNYRWLSWKSHVDVENKKIYAVARDIQNEKISKLEEIRQKQLLQTILNSMGEAVVAADTNFNFLVFNRAAEVMHGIDQENTPLEEWSTCYNMYLPDGKTDFPFEELPLVQAVKGTPTNNVEMIILNKSLDVSSYASVTGRPIYDDQENVIGGVVVFRDITELKSIESDLVTALEKAKEASRAKSDFLSSMSHEIRTPLNAIIGISDILKDTVVTAENKKLVQTVLHSSESLNSLVNDVLDYSKIEAGEVNIVNEHFNLLDLIENIIDVFYLKAKDKEIQLSKDIQKGVPLDVYGDYNHIKQILINLVNNAIKFTSSGFVKIIIGIEDGIHAIEVSDSGIGIPEGKLNIIFENFTQADSTTTKEYGGTGLGLAISKRLANLLNGDITVRSMNREGSTFKLKLPLQFDEKKQDQFIRSIEKNLEGKKIAVIDEGTENRKYVSSVLKALQAKLHEFSTINDFLLDSYSDGSPYDLVVIDRHMLTANIAIGERIKNNSIISETKIILLSSVSKGPLNDIPHDEVIFRPLKRNDIVLKSLQVFGLEPEGSKSGETKSFNFSKFRFLIAEDVFENQLVLKKYFGKLGSDFKLVENGKEALHAFKNETFDLVLLDMQMPVMDGYSAAKEMRSFEKEHNKKRTKIVAQTAYSFKDDLEKCLAAGCDDYITKPIKFNDLKLKLQQTLKI